MYSRRRICTSCESPPCCRVKKDTANEQFLEDVVLSRASTGKGYPISHVDGISLGNKDDQECTALILLLIEQLLKNFSGF